MTDLYSAELSAAENGLDSNWSMHRPPSSSTRLRATYIFWENSRISFISKHLMLSHWKLSKTSCILLSCVCLFEVWSAAAALAMDSPTVPHCCYVLSALKLGSSFWPQTLSRRESKFAQSWTLKASFLPVPWLQVWTRPLCCSLYHMNVALKSDCSPPKMNYIETRTVVKFYLHYLHLFTLKYIWNMIKSQDSLLQTPKWIN